MVSIQGVTCLQGAKDGLVMVQTCEHANYLGITKTNVSNNIIHGVFSRDAMEYARTEILKKSNYLKLLTTQGSLLSSLSLKEEVVEEVTQPYGCMYM